ncbi:battenin-like isoform X2 [Lineus longissimus]|uniref:battenin-like isoform X2 n=1 Tax=Lineus longissimus TaxID=88925 RepID=UPI00315C965A
MRSSAGSMLDDNVEVATPRLDKEQRCRRIRSLTGFWLLGLTNNFAYVIMLSAAHDILEKQNEEEFTAINSTAIPLNSTITAIPLSPALTNSTPANRTPLVENCNPMSTGAILLADILPTLIIKVTAPFYMQSLPYWFRVAFLITLPGVASFLTVALSETVWVSLLGVVFASIGAGYGEITFLAFSAHFDKDVISTWSSGTGGAGVFGALAYAGLTSAGLSPKNTLFLMLVIPVLLAFSYYILIKKPDTVDPKSCKCGNSKESTTPLLVDEDTGDGPSMAAMERGKHLGVKQKLLLIKPLLKYMIPLALVYLAEYFINQGLTELLYFPNETWLSQNEQYRWYQVIYQLGVFFSRSSVNLVKINKLWILPILQFLNIVLLMFQIFYQFIPSIWIVFVIILYEGLLGGAAYVNTFYKISEEVVHEHREYSIGVASVGDSFGIMIAGFASIPVHNFLCSLYR